jgi:regulator of sirC expression with transglutaminase-like and TPR domain
MLFSHDVNARSKEEVRARLYEAADDPAADLAAASLWIAAEEYPEMVVTESLDYLDRLAGRVEARIAKTGDLSQREVLVEEIYDRERFRGNSVEYYDPRNSYLNDVIERRLGIPITLAIVYVSVARRIGRDAFGLGTPGHFLVLDGQDIIDPFDRARTVERSIILTQLGAAGIQDPTAWLDRLCGNPASTKSILARMLVNLRGNHLRRGDDARALDAVDRLVHLDAENPMWLRERGVLYQRLDCPAAAITDLEAYLAKAPNDPEADILRASITRLGRKRPTLQ